MFNPSPDFRALVADRSVHMAGLVAEMLRSLRIRQVDTVHDCPAAASAFATHLYRLALIDAELAAEGDFAGIRALRQAEQQRNRDVPIIAMAAAPSAALIAAARDAGVSEFLRKPFSVQHIALRLAAFEAAPRPFVAAQGYAGPDRRRRTVSGAPGRRAADGGSQPN